MPWEKNFDVEQVLGRAMEAFWARGYEATSIQDLVRATGVNRASLYATYGDKREIFLASLKKYDSSVRRKMLSELSNGDRPREAIEAVFDKFISQASNANANWGCLITNTALELAAHDSEIAQFVNTAQDDMARFFQGMIERGKITGQIGAHVDAAQLARMLLAILLGLLVMLRSRPDANYLNEVKSSALSLL